MSSQIKRAKASSSSPKIEWSKAIDDSFVQRHGHKKSTIDSSSILNKISNNVNGLRNFGQEIVFLHAPGLQIFSKKVALHAHNAIQSFVSSNTDISEEYDSDDDSKQRAKVINVALSQADRYLWTAADEVVEICKSADPPDDSFYYTFSDGCLSDEMFSINGDESFVDPDNTVTHDEEGPKRRRTLERKASVEKPSCCMDADLILSADVLFGGTSLEVTDTSINVYSINGDSFISIESDGSCSESSLNSKSVSTFDSYQRLRLNKLRKRSDEFLRRTAIDSADGVEDEESTSLQHGGLKKMLRNVPIQVLQWKKKKQAPHDLLNMTY